MKILHVLVNYHPSVGGTQLFYKGISENCVKFYGDDVEVLTVDSYYGPHSNQYKQIVPSEESINGVLVRRMPFFRRHRQPIILLNKTIRKIFGKRIAFLDRYMTGPWSPQLKAVMDETGADVISASSNGYLFMSYPLYRHKLPNPKPFVYQGAIHFSEDENEQVISNETLKAIKASEYYLSNTSFEKDRLVKLGVPEENVIVVGSAVDMKKFDTGNAGHFRNVFGLGDDDILVGYIGRLENTKRIDVLLYGFEKAWQQNNKLSLVIAGFKYDYVKELEAIVEKFEKQLQHRVHFVFDLSVQDKVNLYHALDIYASASVNESFGMVFLEAWSCKKPVIGASIGAIRSVIDEGGDGLLVKPNDSESMRDKILQLANDALLRQELGENGFNKTSQHFTWEVVTEKYRNTYLMAIEKFNANHKK